MIYKRKFNEEYEPKLKGSYPLFNQLIHTHNLCDEFASEYGWEIKESSKKYMYLYKLVKKLIEFADKNLDKIKQELKMYNKVDYTSFIMEAEKNFKKSSQKDWYMLDLAYSEIHSLIKILKDNI